MKTMSIIYNNYFITHLLYPGQTGSHLPVTYLSASHMLSYLPPNNLSSLFFSPSQIFFHYSYFIFTFLSRSFFHLSSCPLNRFTLITLVFFAISRISSLIRSSFLILSNLITSPYIVHLNILVSATIIFSIQHADPYISLLASQRINFPFYHTTHRLSLLDPPPHQFIRPLLASPHVPQFLVRLLQTLAFFFLLLIS